MKRILAIIVLLISTLAVKAETTGDTTHIRTPLRLMLPDDTGGWTYYFHIDGIGVPPTMLAGKEFTLMMSNNKKYAQQGYIYAENADHTRRTNKYFIKATGRPMFYIIKGTNGVIVSAKKLRVNKYMVLRSHIPEAQRAPWIN